MVKQIAPWCSGRTMSSKSAASAQLMLSMSLHLSFEPARSRHTKSFFRIQVPLSAPPDTPRPSAWPPSPSLSELCTRIRIRRIAPGPRRARWGATANQVTSLKVAQKSMKLELSRLLCRDVAVWTRLRCPLSALHGGAAPFCTDFVSEHLQALAHRESPQNSQNPRCARRGWVCEALTEILAVVS